MLPQHVKRPIKKTNSIGSKDSEDMTYYVLAPGCEAVDEARLANVANAVVIELDPLQVFSSVIHLSRSNSA